MPSRCVWSVARSRAKAFTDCFLTVAPLVCLGGPVGREGWMEGARSSRRVPEAPRGPAPASTALRLITTNSGFGCRLFIGFCIN